MVVRVSELRNAGSGSYADLDDRMLVLDFQAGNPEAFDEIHRRYSALARHICLRILGNPEDAAEASQEAMLRVFQGLGRFNGRYALQPWVARIATNVSLDVTRARARRPQIGDRPLSELDPDEARTLGEDPSELLERSLECEQVKAVLEQLPAHHRDALVLREFEGRSHEEIGNALGVTPPQAKALIHRAKGSFRRAWHREEERRRGFGVLVPWLLAPFRASDWLRRLFDSAAEAAATALASPAAATTAVSTGERVTAAAVAVIMATTVGVGVVAVRHMSAGADAQPAPVLAPPPVAPPAQLVVLPELAQPKQANKHGRVKAVVPSPAAGFASTTPSPSVSPTPPASPGLAPEPTDVTYAFLSDVTTDYRCGCGTAPVMTSTVDASDAGVTSFSATIDQAGAADSTGEIAWPLWLEQSSPNGTDHAMTFTLTTPGGPYRYTAQGAVVSSEPTDWGGWTYVFEGTYSFYSGPTGPDGTVPGYGSYRATVSLSWRTARVVDTSVTLIENVPSPSDTPTPSPSATPTASPSATPTASPTP